MCLRNVTVSLLFSACISALVVSGHESAQQIHQLAKRQLLSYPYTTTNLAPTLPQSSYTFSGACTSGNILGTITSTSLYGFPATYSVDSGSGTGSYYVYAQPTTGQIYLCTPTSGTFTFNFRAANQYGAIAVPVTVTCTGTTTTTTTTLFSTCPYTGLGTSSIYPYGSTYPYSTGTTYPYTTGISPYTTYPYTTGTTYPYTTGTYPYTGTTGLTYPYTGTTYPYTTGTAYPYTTGTYPYSTGLTYPYTTGTTYPYTGTTYPYTTGTTYPYTGTTYPFSTGTSFPFGTTGLTGTTGTVTFSQNSYNFTTTQCTSGSTVGTVSGTGSGYTIVTGGNGVFSISPSGQITLTSQLYTGTYSLVVSGGSTTNQRPVTIIANCQNSGFTPGLFGRKR
ncbi:mucin-2-like [Paramacrobiotus metropolitanus]|uniref:mucin-2-like n=1 Tax=Paramacrobiotus metropolitanus TaxID=2943436 RepID=UPI0024456DDA|nr:mucin-2-like [Paramacrobiotus metropolitanus]